MRKGFDSDQPEAPTSRGRTTAQKGASARAQLSGKKAEDPHEPYRKRYRRPDTFRMDPMFKEAAASIDKLIAGES